jgi:AcrR family transcriptional regulator
MPRIDAPTVVEHHARRRAALIAAANDLLASGGVEAVTLAAVGAAAGLARSSVYQYFDSAGALLAAMIMDAFPQTNAQLMAAVAESDEPPEQVGAYIRTCLDSATDQAHRALSVLGSAELPTNSLERIAALHREQLAPLIGALSRLDLPDPALTAGLIMGAIGAATHAIVAGADRGHVQGQMMALVERGILGTGRPDVAAP